MIRRYKGRPSGKTIVRDFLFIVKIAVPRRGLGKQLNAMHAFHKKRGIHVAVARHRHEDQDYVFWCFAHRVIAEEFAAEFRGTLMPDAVWQAPTHGDVRQHDDEQTLCCLLFTWILMN
jgi:hypothetical protein